MRRRKFIHSSALFGTIFLIPNSIKAGKDKSYIGPKIDIDIEKVKTAMLSMQRASWEQGVAAQACLELGDKEMTYLMAKEAVLRQLEDGRLSVLYTDNGVTDPAASGEAVLRAAEWHNDDELRAASNKMLEFLLEKAPRSSEGILYHTMNSPELWIDSMYMAPPFLSVMRHHEEAMKQIRGLRKILWSEENQLYSHRWHDGDKKFINENFWGVGNGWVTSGLSRVVQSLPENMAEEKKELIGYIRQTLDGCLKFIRKDHLFHNNLDKPDSFVETNLSQMLAYTIFRGIQYGWLDKDYLQTGENMRTAAHSKVDQHGYVQDVCGAPFFNKAGRAAEGQAFYLLMEAAYRDLNKKA